MSLNALICITTGQSLVNLIPALQFRPKRIYLIVTHSFTSKAAQFVEIIKKTMTEPEQPEVILFENCPDSGIAEITSFINDKVIPEIKNWEAVAVNLSGGTKQHSFVLYQSLKDRVKDAFYVDTQERKLEHYPLDNKPPKTEPLPSLLTIDSTLRGMGKQILSIDSKSEDWRQGVLERAELTRFMIQHIDQLYQLIGEFNTVINKFYKDKSLYNRSASLELFTRHHGIPLKVLEKSHDMKILHWPDHKKVEFTNYQQARYFAGDWLEEYAWLCAQDIGLEEVGCNVHFSNTRGDKQDQLANNELDLVVVHANAMMAVECKAATAAQKDSESQNMFHKLSGVANRAGGLMCSKLFLSAFPLTYKNGADIASLNHAREQGINILHSTDLKYLTQVFESWRDTSRVSRPH